MPPASSARPLLVAGAVSSPLFLLSVVVQASTKDGFDSARHPLSSLALGESGWIQVVTFLASGALMVAGAVGLRRTLTEGPASRWGPRLIGVNGVALMLAGAFAPDPINGYPVGAVDTVSWHGAVHSMGPALSGLAGLAAFVVFARRFAADHRRGWLTWTIAAPIAILALNAAAIALADFRAVLVGQLVGAAWLASLFASHLRRVAVSPQWMATSPG